MYHTEPITNTRNYCTCCRTILYFQYPVVFSLKGWIEWLVEPIFLRRHWYTLRGHGAAFHDTMVHYRCDILPYAYIWSCCSVQHERITSNQYLISLEIVTLSYHKIEFSDSQMYLLLYLGWKIEVQYEEQMQSLYNMSGNAGTLAIQYSAANVNFDCILCWSWAHPVQEPMVQWPSNLTSRQPTHWYGVWLTFICIRWRSAPY